MTASVAANGQPIASQWVVGPGSVATAVAVTAVPVSSAWSVPAGYGVLGLQFGTGQVVSSTWVVPAGSMATLDLYRFMDAPEPAPAGTGAPWRFTDA
jgi:hypothetical protein